jgi:hypothetical protein
MDTVVGNLIRIMNSWYSTIFKALINDLWYCLSVPITNEMFL